MHGARRLGRKAVMLVALHAHDCLHLARLQHTYRDLRHDARPLCASKWWRVERIHHLLVHTKVQVVYAVQVPASAADT